MRCDGTPDPTIPSEINTFINQLIEEPRSSVEDAFTKSKILLSLADEISFIIEDTPADTPLDELEMYKTVCAL